MSNARVRAILPGGDGPAGRDGVPASILNDYIKCVVVGDSGVGKTDLITTWACDTSHSLKDLVKTRMSTVWAHDHYLDKDRNILERSVVEVDGVPVSLRLWDTFGYHDRDNGFAYKGADVVLLCFNLGQVRSLHNLKKLWVPEIRRFLPTTPVVIAGCQADLRYQYRNAGYINMTKGLLYRTVREKDIVTPEEGRAVAKEIGCPYYECSILTKQGVWGVFVNVVRAAMVERRKLRFWSSKLRRIQFPQIQAPMKLPCLKLPTVEKPPTLLHDDFCQLLDRQSEGDVVFVVRGQRFTAHKICLVIGADVFRDLFLPCVGAHSAAIVNSNTASTVMVESNLNYKSVTNNDNESLLAHEEVPSSCFSTGSIDSNQQVNLATNHPAFVAIEHGTHCDDPFQSGQNSQQTVVTLHSDITPQAWQYILECIYTGTVKARPDVYNDVQVAALLLQLPNLALRILNIQSDEEYLNLELDRIFREERRRKLVDLALNQELLTDIQFQVDDGIVAAHKPLLSARCEMMAAMFSNNFLEASAHVIVFPGISRETFLLLREFLYTGDLSVGPDSDYLELIAVGDRLCLPRLVGLVEATIADVLTLADMGGEDIVPEVLQLLEAAQLHKATQLSTWCLQYLCNHYLPLCKRHMKMFKQLTPENVEFIEKNRWPPDWYVHELTYYEPAQALASSPKKTSIQQRHQIRNSAVCLCFCRRSQMVMDDINSPA